MTVCTPPSRQLKVAIVTGNAWGLLHFFPVRIAALWLATKLASLTRLARRRSFAFNKIINNRLIRRSI
ncbi:hypothetical protein ARC02_12950 [Stenotrophomonas africana]|nr:hypothetical protein ARC02_12950 [Stenotrophomonas maltophilia]